MRRYKFCVGSTADDSHDAIAFSPAVRVSAWLRHLAGKFQPGNVLSGVRRRSISTLPLQKIGTIERSTSHVNENFVRLRLRFWNVLDFQHLWSTETSNDDSFHG